MPEPVIESVISPSVRRRLAERNKRLTAYQHRLTVRERVRRQLIRTAAAVPTLIQHPEQNTILVIRPDHLGDMLLSMPAIQALRQAQPHARIVMLCGGWAADVCAAYPEIDLVLTLPFPGFTRTIKPGNFLTPYREAWRWAKSLRKLKADTAIILRPDHWFGGLLAKWAGIPNRIGFDQPDLSPLLSARVPLERDHAVKQSMALIGRAIGSGSVSGSVKLTYPIEPADRRIIDQRLSGFGIKPSDPVVCIHPGAGTALKRWPPGSWAWIADQLIARWDCAVILTGSESESGEAQAVRSAMRYPNHAVSLTGETSIRTLAALFARSRVVCGSDSGPLHLAVASGAPTVHLYGPADPVQFGPYGDPARQIVLASSIACRPCGILDWRDDAIENHPCVRDITPRDVLDAALRAGG